MKKPMILIAMASLITGCATDKGQRAGQHSGPAAVAPAVRKLPQGDSPGAARVLKAVCKGKAVSGKDEALFRLALLSLKPNTEMPVSPRGRQLLKRLKKEYPASPWTAQAAQLMEFIKVTDELAHRNQDLKASKEALTAEINDLNQKIKQLKSLDLELEKTR